LKVFELNEKKAYSVRSEGQQQQHYVADYFWPHHPIYDHFEQQQPMIGYSPYSYQNQEPFKFSANSSGQKGKNSLNKHKNRPKTNKKSLGIGENIIQFNLDRIEMKYVLYRNYIHLNRISPFCHRIESKANKQCCRPFLGTDSSRGICRQKSASNGFEHVGPGSR
jgi:hypothetical protein